MQEAVAPVQSSTNLETSQPSVPSATVVPSSDISQFHSKSIDFKKGIWLLGLSSWGVGIFSRTVLALTDGYLTVVELSQVLLSLLLFLSWLCFKPNSSDSSASCDYSILKLSEYQTNFNDRQRQLYLDTTQLRMAELRNQHMITQEYVFPFPYLCQIYHLLNLKHLEDVHNFSLSNLKVVKVSETQSTTIGGTMRFQTILDSPINTLRIWRQSLVEVELILHTPYTIELNIPAYGDKRIIVIFNIVPLTPEEHKLFIDIYSNLRWPKPILKMLLHIASSLTVFEDFPYLRKLAQRNLTRLMQPNRVSSHETMWLFRRFSELYGTGL
jgi:hypothetical protein